MKHRIRAATPDAFRYTFWTVLLALAAIVAPGMLTGCTASHADLQEEDSLVTTLAATGVKLSAVTLTPASSTLPPTTTVALTAMGTFTDGSTRKLAASAFTWSSDAIAFATVDSAGLVTARAAGSAGITAVHKATKIAGGASVVVPDVQLVTLTVTPAVRKLALGTKANLVANGTFSNATTFVLTKVVAWSSDHLDVATVSPAGQVQAVGIGTAVITATHSSGKTAAATITVGAATIKSLTVTPAAASLPRGTTQALVATAIFTDGTAQDVTSTAVWTSSAPVVASVSTSAGPRGVVTAVDTGTAVITAKAGGKTALANVTVTAAVITSVEVSPTAVTLPVGTTASISAMAHFSDGSSAASGLSWSIGQPAVASVSNAPGEQGKVTALGAGIATVTVTHDASGKSASATITVTPAALLSLDVTPPSVTSPMGVPVAFTAQGRFTDGTLRNVTSDVAWTVERPDMASVLDPSVGRVMPVAVGTSKIVASAPGGVSAEATLVVSPAVLVSIAIQGAGAAPFTLPRGTQKLLTAVGTYTDGQAKDISSLVTWSSSDETRAIVSNVDGIRGHVSALDLGTTLISALDPETGTSATIFVDVTAPLLTSVIASAPRSSLPLGESMTIRAIATYSDGSVADLTAASTWTSTYPAIATVSNVIGSEGLVTPVSPGTVLMQASGPGYAVSLEVVVVGAQVRSLAISPSALTVAVGHVGKLTATATMTDGSVADVTASMQWSSYGVAVAGAGNGRGAGLVAGQSLGSTVIGAVDLVTGIAATATVAVTPSLVDDFAANFSPTFNPIGNFRISESREGVERGLVPQMWASGLDGYANLTRVMHNPTPDVIVQDRQRLLPGQISLGAARYVAAGAETRVSSVVTWKAPRAGTYVLRTRFSGTTDFQSCRTALPCGVGHPGPYVITLPQLFPSRDLCGNDWTHWHSEGACVSRDWCTGIWFFGFCTYWSHQMFCPITTCEPQIVSHARVSVDAVDAEVFAATLNEGSAGNDASFERTFTFSAGDSLRFVVAPNTPLSVYDDSAALDARIERLEEVDAETQAIWKANAGFGDMGVLSTGNVTVWPRRPEALPPAPRRIFDGATGAAVPFAWSDPGAIGYFGTNFIGFPGAGGQDTFYSSWCSGHVLSGSGDFYRNIGLFGCADYQQGYAYDRNGGRVWYANGGDVASFSTTDPYAPAGSVALGLARSDFLSISGNTVYVSGLNVAARGNLTSGVLDWSVPIDTVAPFHPLRRGAIDTGDAFVVTSIHPDHGLLARIDPAGNVLFSKDVGAITTPVIDAANDIYVGTSKSGVHTVSSYTASGALRWSEVVGKAPSDLLLADDGNVYVLLGGEIAAVSSDQDNDGWATGPAYATSRAAGPASIVALARATGARGRSYTNLESGGTMLLSNGHLLVKTRSFVYALATAAMGYEPGAPWPVKQHDNLLQSAR